MSNGQCTGEAIQNKYARLLQRNSESVRSAAPKPLQQEIGLTVLSLTRTACAHDHRNRIADVQLDRLSV